MTSYITLKKYHRIITDCWQLLKKYSSPTDEEQFWLELIREANDIYTFYGCSSFCQEVLLAVIAEIENIYKSEKHISNHEQVSMF